MRAGRVAAAVGVVALLAAGAWLAWPGEEDVGLHDGPAPEVPTVHVGLPGHVPPKPLEGSDGGAWTLHGVVLDGEAPSAGALVQVFQAADVPFANASCEACGRPLLWCSAPDSARQVLAQIRAGLPRPAPIATASTDAQGRFEVGGLPGVTLSVRVSAGNLVGGAELEDQPGPEETLEISLSPVPKRTLKIVDGKGKPVPGLPVTLAAFQTGEVLEATSDRDGQVPVTLGGVEEVWAGVDAPGWLPTGEVIEPDGELVVYRPRALIVHTRMGGRPIDADVHLQLHGERTARTKDGTVRFDDLFGDDASVWATTADLSSEPANPALDDAPREVTLELRRTASLDLLVVGPDGTPVEDPWIELSSAGNMLEQAPDTVEGHTRFRDVPEGAYTLTVNASGYYLATRELDLQPGLTELRLVLQSRPVVRGRVVDDKGQPVENAEVWARDTVDPEASSTTTDEDGSFELEADGKGPVTVEAWNQEKGRGSAKGHTGGEVEVRLEPGAVIELEVDDPDGKPVVESVRLVQVETGRSFWGETAEPFGRFSGLEPGKWQVSINRNERLPVTKDVELGRGQVLRLRLKLDAGAAVDGRVLDAHGAPMPGARVLFSGGVAATTDERGQFSLTGVTPGPVELTAFDRESGRSASAEATAPARDVVIRFEATFRVTGRVTDEAGRPLPSFRVDNLDVSNPDGHFDEQVEAGSLRIQADGYKQQRFDVTGDTALGTVRLVAMGKVQGEVLSQGRPVPGAVVHLEEQFAETVTDAAGRFTLALDYDYDWPLHVLAFRGGSSGRAEAQEGRPVRIELSAGTHVIGHVVDHTGRAVESEVAFTISDVPQHQQVAVSDARGRFEIDLLPGQWTAITRPGTTQLFTISGAQQEITIIDSAACVLSLVAPDVDEAWLVPAGVDTSAVAWEDGTGLPQGTLVPTVDSEPASSAVGCGRYVLVTMRNHVVARQPVDLQPGRTVVRVAPAPAAPPGPVE